MVDIASIQDIQRLLDAQKAEIIAAFEERLKSDKSSSNSKWLRTRHVKDMLNVSDSTLFTYRANGLLKSKKIRGSHFYLKSDVFKMMENEK